MGRGLLLMALALAGAAGAQEPGRFAPSCRMRLVGATTNLLTHSEQFDNAAWIKDALVITANAATAPDGTATADKLAESASESFALYAARQLVTLDEGRSYVATFYAKAGERSWLRITPSGLDGTQRHSYFDLASGTVGTVASGATAAIEQGPGGWWRCSVAFPSGSGASAPTIRAAVTTADNLSGYSGGDGTSGLYIWGAQLTAGPLPLHYCPTTDAAATCTATPPSRWRSCLSGGL